jgi:nitrate/nitrite-specific signal transduction histidine kinase
MHDGLAQFLGYLNLQVQTLKSLFVQEEKVKFLAELENMREAIRIAHADVRENILSLRTTLANEKGLISAIGEYLEEFCIQTGISTELKNQLAGDLNLSSIAEVQLVCILQEALTNVRKHAQASEVKVTLDQMGINGSEFIFMKIVDNGIGFTFSKKKRSFGLKTMTERAESVKGDLVVTPISGRGTTIECRLPCLEKERLEQPSRILS